MKLLIVESPAKAKTINQYIGKEYIVLSSYGHVRAIPRKNNAVEIQDGHIAIHYETLQTAIKNITKLTQASKNASAIYFATDPDREGEAISWHLLEVLKQQEAIKKDVELKRIVFHEITPTAIKAAINDWRDIDMNLVHAQQARQALDYIVGFTLSPLLWRKLPGSKSAGRVQSVALRIVCEREVEIENFKKQEYWKISGIFNTNEQKEEFEAELTRYHGKQLDKLAIANQENATSIIETLLQYKYHVSYIETKRVTNNPKPPFTTSTLLQEASYKLGFSAKKTSSIAQRLYEGINIENKPVALITYMRTDSVYVSSEVANKANALIAKLYGSDYAPSRIRTYKNKIKNAQEAHEAIRPVDPSILPDEIKSSIEVDFYKLYELIWKRFIASQMTNAILESTVIEIGNSNTTAQSKPDNIFKASGSVVVFSGYRKVYTDTTNQDGKKERTIKDENEEGHNTKQMLPKLDNLQPLQIVAMDKTQHYTKPQPRFNEASLIKKMEELGIGRPSTYPTMISILQDRKYVTLKNKQFIAEPRGRLVSAFLTNFFNEYVQYAFTAQMEDTLDDISRGEREYKSELVRFWTRFKERASNVMALKTQDVLQKIEETLMLYIYDGYGQNIEECKELKICPLCKVGTLALKNSKFGPFIGCSQYPECKFTKQFYHNETNINSTEQEAATEIVEKEWPKVLGIDQSDGHEILLNKGPYGFYVMKKITKFETNETKESKNTTQKQKKAKARNVKIVGLPKAINSNDVTLEYAQKLLELPKAIGIYPQDESEIKIGIGKYGPYIQYNKKFISIKKANFMDITYEEALELIKNHKPR